MDNLIYKYLRRIETEGDLGESYKWEAINHFQKTWDIEAKDFTEMFLDAFSKIGNLLYQNSWGFITKAVKHFPEEVKEMFKNLFNDEEQLENRILVFQRSAKALVPDVKKATGKSKLNHQQDERTLAVYLTFMFPERYFLYKSSFYGAMCQKLGVQKMRSGKRLIHYLQLAEDVKKQYIQNNVEIKNLHAKKYPKTTWNNNNLITQNFLYTMLEFEETSEIKNNVLEFREEVVPKSRLHLNQIIYGPPGTGKTYKLLNEYFDRFTVKETSLTRKQYLENMISELTWWQVLSMVVFDLGKCSVNQIIEHELISIKIELSTSKNPRATIWGVLQSHTVEECEHVNITNRSEPRLFFKDKKSQWTIDETLLKEYYPEAITNFEETKVFSPRKDKLIKNYEFVTFHQSFSYEDFVEGIKPKMEEQESEVSYEIADGVFKKISLKAKADPGNDYAIFIDEINRGNISAIFGELITLIEEDKRLSGENPLVAKLPYSKKEFGIPSNLYVIGTMNTADRSVEALDTALRRRFSFIEIMPDPLLLEDIEFDGFNLKEVLETINERIEFLLDRDHTIGHSYFMNLESGDTDELEAVLKNNVIPLLQEYFYHDYEKIALILGTGFVSVKPNHVITFASNNYINSPDSITKYELVNNIDNIEEAIVKLLNRK